MAEDTRAPVKHIDPDDLEDREWDAMVAAVSCDHKPAEQTGRHVLDAWEAPWIVDDVRAAPERPTIYLGRPVPIAGPQGPAVIITTDLRDYLMQHQRSPDLIDLPISRTTVTRLRRALGLNWYEDGERWWIARWNDLLTLTVADFVVRHSVKPAAVTYARLNLIGPRQRKAYWWKDVETADLILSPQPRIYVAQMLGIAASSVGRLRSKLRRERGEPMDASSASERMAQTKRGQPAHPNTKAALLAAAKAPKSDEWRAGQSERNRTRPRPQSWLDREWSADEQAMLGMMPDRIVAEKLGRTIAAVRSRRQRLGIRAHITGGEHG